MTSRPRVRVAAPLARFEIEIVFRKLAERFESIELSGELPTHRDRLTRRAPTAVPLKLRTRSSASGLAARPADDDAEWRARYRELRDAGGDAINEAERAARTAMIDRVPFFRSCPPEDLATLAATAYPLALDVGDQLCVEGADAPDCYVIAAGEAAVTIGGVAVRLRRRRRRRRRARTALGRAPCGNGHRHLAHDHRRDLPRTTAIRARTVPGNGGCDARRDRAPLLLSLRGFGSRRARAARVR